MRSSDNTIHARAAAPAVLLTNRDGVDAFILRYGIGENSQGEVDERIHDR
jgi:hypothetical protein